MYLIYLRLLSTQINTRLPKTMAIDSANIKKAFSMSSVAGKVVGQPFPFGQHELLDRDGATSNAPLVESNIVGACDYKQRFFLLNKSFRSWNTLSGASSYIWPANIVCVPVVSPVTLSWFGFITAGVGCIVEVI